MKTKNEIQHLLSMYKPTAESKYGYVRSLSKSKYK